MIWAYFAMIAVFYGYVAGILVKYGMLPSISDSFYALPRNKSFIFTLVLWTFSILSMIIGDSVLMFIAGSGIAFVGTAAQFKQKLTNTVHVVGAVVGIGFSQASIIVDMRLWYVSVSFLIIGTAVLLLKRKIRHFIWWIEILAFTSVAVSFGIKLL